MVGASKKLSGMPPMSAGEVDHIRKVERLEQESKTAIRSPEPRQPLRGLCCLVIGTPSVVNSDQMISVFNGPTLHFAPHQWRHSPNGCGRLSTPCVGGRVCLWATLLVIGPSLPGV